MKKKLICLLTFIALIAHADPLLFLVIAVKKSELPAVKEKVIDKLIEQRAFPDTQKWRDWIIQGTQTYTNAAGTEWVLYVDSVIHMDEGIIPLTTNRLNQVRTYVGGGANVKWAVTQDAQGLIASYGLFPKTTP